MPLAICFAISDYNAGTFTFPENILNSSSYNLFEPHFSMFLYSITWLSCWLYNNYSSFLFAIDALLAIFFFNLPCYYSIFGVDLCLLRVLMIYIERFLSTPFFIPPFINFHFLIPAGLVFWFWLIGIIFAIFILIVLIRVTVPRFKIESLSKLGWQGLLSWITLIALLYLLALLLL